MRVCGCSWLGTGVQVSVEMNRELPGGVNGSSLVFSLCYYLLVTQSFINLAVFTTGWEQKPPQTLDPPTWLQRIFIKALLKEKTR